MRLGIVYFVAVILTVLALAPAGAQLLELPGRMSLIDQDYIFVQQVNRGWTWDWILLPIAFAADVALVFAMGRRGGYKLVSISAVLMAAALLVHFLFIYPVDQKTADWLLLPVNWEALRAEWEYGQATIALLAFLSLCALMLAAPVQRRVGTLHLSGYRMDLWYLR